jgi:hypothetical protein
MAKSHRLRHLKVGEAWHDGLGVLRSQFDNAGLETGELFANDIDFSAQIEPHIGRDLIVAGAPRVQFFTDIAN